MIDLQARIHTLASRVVRTMKKKRDRRRRPSVSVSSLKKMPKKKMYDYSPPLDSDIIVSVMRHKKCPALRYMTAYDLERPHPFYTMNTHHIDGARYILQTLKTLPTKEELAIRCFFGIGTYQHTLVETSQVMDLTPDRTKRIIRKVLHKLKHHSQLQDYW